MNSRIKRKGYIHINRYQRPVLILALGPLTLLCLAISIYVVILKKEVTNLILFTTDPPSIRALNIWGGWLLCGLWVAFLFMAWGIYRLSSRYLGPFERIMRELDGILAGNGRTAVRARKGDDLANDLLERINRLLERLPQHDPSDHVPHP